MKPPRSAPPKHEVARRLFARYGDFAHNNRRTPLNELLFILCSVKTSEANYERAYRDFRRAFPTFDSIAASTARDLAASLWIGGLYRTKARRLKKAMRLIVKAFGRPTLAPLRRMSDRECEAFLTSLPGVGLKVARCVMMYALGRQVFPVDTHCWRICRRLGWVRGTATDGLPTRRDMGRLQSKIPSGLRYSLHVNLVSFGRETCRAPAPNCGSCVLSDLCPRIV